MADPAGAPPRTLPIRLTTRHANHAIPDEPYLVPLDWRRTQLSQLVNKVLGYDRDGARTVPFDFVVDGQLLRGSLQSWLEQKGLTEETTLHIEYIESLLPPQYVSAFEHDDWVSAVDASRKGLFVTASYDGSVRIFSALSTEAPLATFSSAPAGSVNSSLVDVCWLPTSETSTAGEQSMRLATAGLDGVVRAWELPNIDPATALATGASEAVRPTALFTGHYHAHPLSSLVASANGNYLLSAGWDGALGLWSTSIPSSDETPDTSAPVLPADEDEDEEGESRRKRRKASKKSADEGRAKRKAPLQTLFHTTPAASVALVGAAGIAPGPNARLGRAIFKRQGALGEDGQPATAYSAGWDGAVKEWDLEVGRMTSAKSSEKVILSMDQMTGTSSVLVTSHMDRTIALWDLRSDTTNISINFPSAHSSPISRVVAHPTSSQLLCSAGHDGLVKIWDTRSPRQALFALTRPASADATAGAEAGSEQAAKKLLALDWDAQAELIVAGGEDCKLTVHRGNVGRQDGAQGQAEGDAMQL